MKHQCLTCKAQFSFCMDTSDSKQTVFIYVYGKYSTFTTNSTVKCPNCNQPTTIADDRRVTRSLYRKMGLI